MLCHGVMTHRCDTVGVVTVGVVVTVCVVTVGAVTTDVTQWVL